MGANKKKASAVEQSPEAPQGIVRVPSFLRDLEDDNPSSLETPEAINESINTEQKKQRDTRPRAATNRAPPMSAKQAGKLELTEDDVEPF